jgi:hypothetical protein
MLHYAQEDDMMITEDSGSDLKFVDHPKLSNLTITFYIRDDGLCDVRAFEKSPSGLIIFWEGHGFSSVQEVFATLTRFRCASPRPDQWVTIYHKRSGDVDA